MTERLRLYGTAPPWGGENHARGGARTRATLIAGMAAVPAMGTGESERDPSVGTGLLLQGQGAHLEQDEMPDSPLRYAFELIHFYLLHNGEEGIEVNVARLSIGEEFEIDPDYAIKEAVRTGLVEEYKDNVTRQRFIRRGPRNAEMLRQVYGRDSPTTLESISADASASRKRREVDVARLEAIREAGRPKGHNTAGSLPAWMP